MGRPNILLVILDATRADSCSCYGEEHNTTPALDRLAAEGVLFEQAISPAPWTLPAMASLFTGLFPGQTGIYGRRALPSSFPTLAQVLSQNGYETFCITNNSWLSADFGLLRGFTYVHKQWQRWQAQHEVNKLVLMERSRGAPWMNGALRELMQGNPLKNVVNAAYNRLGAYRVDAGARRMLRPLQRWIEARPGPWFALVHYLEAHLPYKPPLEWADRFAHDPEHARAWIQADQWRAAWRHIAGVELLSPADLVAWRDLYRAEVAYADYYFGLLIDWLERTQRLEDTLVVVVADHGESLGEHGLLNHQYCIYDTLLHVPLILRFPAALPQGRRVSYPVQALDTFQTILDVVGVNAPVSASQNLLAPDPRPFTIAEYGAPRPPHPGDLVRFDLQPEALQRFARGLTAIRTDRHKLIVGTDGSVELYAWPQDPGEEENLAATHPGVVQELRAMLARWHQELGTSPIGDAEAELEMDPATAARLQALGYIE